MKTRKVYFEIVDVPFVEDYCKTHGITMPECKEIGNRDWYFATDEVWARLYWNCPYAVTGCYVC